jgi:hypothetical protein
MEVFLTHPTSLIKFYELIFPHGDNKLKSLERSTTNYHDDLTYFITEQPIVDNTRINSTEKYSQCQSSVTSKKVPGTGVGRNVDAQSLETATNLKLSDDMYALLDNQLSPKHHPSQAHLSSPFDISNSQRQNNSHLSPLPKVKTGIRLPHIAN